MHNKCRKPSQRNQLITNFHILEYLVLKASEVNDMINQFRSRTGYLVCIVTEDHINHEHIEERIELGQKKERISEFFVMFEKYSPLFIMAGRVTAKP